MSKHQTRSQRQASKRRHLQFMAADLIPKSLRSFVNVVHKQEVRILDISTRAWTRTLIKAGLP